MEQDMKHEATNLLTIFAHSLAEGTSASSPLQMARERGWIDGRGNLTPEGLALSEALSEQSGTRSVFRIG